MAAGSATTTRAVYSLFGDKEGLLRALFREMAETMRQHHEAVPAAQDPVREIVDLARAYRREPGQHRTSTTSISAEPPRDCC